VRKMFYAMLMAAIVAMFFTAAASANNSYGVAGIAMPNENTANIFGLVGQEVIASAGITASSVASDTIDYLIYVPYTYNGNPMSQLARSMEATPFRLRS